MTRPCTFLAALLFWLAASLVPVHAAVDETQLLPIDEAFALSATATGPGRIEFTWKIADGYYLYRHRTAVEPVGASFRADPLQMPAGHRYTDEFFGDVETYRDALTAVQTGAAADGAGAVTFRVRYQGCADVGVCYPPHMQEVTVRLPPAPGAADPGGVGDRPGMDPAPAGAARSVDAALAALGNGGTFPGDPAAGGTDPAIASGGLPLPENQAFRFEAIVAGPDRLLLRYTPAPGYYLYRDRSEIAVGAPGARAGQAQWPAPTAHTDEHFGDVQVYFDQIDVPLPLLRTSTGAMPATVTATFQGCQTDGICYPPMTRTVALQLPAGGTLAAAGADGDTGAGGRETPPRAADQPLWLALLAAFAGGIVLNLFPCVLPVLSLKVLGLAQSGESRAKARSQALWYTAGVLASFAALGAIALALREAGRALGWGFQLQQPGVVALLALVMVGLGLSLSGVVNVGAGLAGVGDRLTRKSGPAGDFFTGVLAVVVATPCTAPFMGGALAYAFASPPVLAMPVFLAMGLGLALPFLLIGFVPALAARLPKPGAWMETLKQVLAFPLYVTAAYLVWVLGSQRGIDAMFYVLVGAVVLALGLWLWEMARWRGPAAKALAALLVLAALYPVLMVQAMAPAARVAAEGEVAYSAERLAQLRSEGRIVFVNMTADWCITCKANEKLVFSGDGFHAAMAAHDVVYMKGDWTDVDPEITRFLESHGAVGVPLYVVYPRQGEPAVLPTVLTEATVAAALADADR